MIASAERELKGEKKQYYTAMIVRWIMKVFLIFPVQNNKVFCIVSSGKGYYDSPKYITERLLEYYPGKFQIVWAVEEPGSIKHDGVKFIKTFSIRHLYHYSTAKVIIVNGGMPTYMPKRRKQCSICIWHGGGAYKKTAIYSRYRLMLNEYKGRCLDIYMSSCKRFSDFLIPDLSPKYKGEIMPSGMPRNDIFFQDNIQEIRHQVCTKLNINENDLIVLYAPTFRGGFDNYTSKTTNISHDWDIDVEGLCEALYQRFKKKVTFMFRKHELDPSDQFMAGIDITSYPDIQEILCATDILISDYSSIIWDFSLTKRPCFLYVPDKDYYLNQDRGVYTPIEDWPGIICETNTKIIEAVRDFDTKSYSKKVDKHHKDMGSYETGTACKQICERIAKVCL